MKRRLFILLLCAVLLTCSLPCSDASAADSVCFVAVNENLLELSCTPYFAGGATYLPYWVYTDYGFNIYYSYFSDTNTAMLYTSTKQLIFELSTGKTYDERDNSYSGKAVMRNGQVYFPATLVCNFFGGMACSYISGSDYGDIVRLKDSRVVLSDVQFIRAASTLMQSRYEAYKSSPGQADIQSPDSSGGSVAHKGTCEYLSFIGLPTPTILSALKRYDIRASFFLTSADVVSSPEAVSRIICDGHSVGVLCEADPTGEYEEAAALIFEATHTKTLLVTALGDGKDLCKETADALGLVYWSYNIDGMSTDSVQVRYENISSLLESRDRASSIFLTCDQTTDSFIGTLLSDLTEGLYDVREVRETDVWPEI